LNFLDLIKSEQTHDSDDVKVSSKTDGLDKIANKAISESARKHKAKPKFVPNSAELTDNEYFAIVNPKTGLRFDIPMLVGNDPHYYAKYVEYMKLRQKNPEEFNRIMEWN